MKILGISAYYHDSAAALIDNGDIVAAAQEERFTRKKHDHSFPTHAIEFCLRQAKITGRELDYVVFYEKTFTKFERLLETYLTFAPAGFRSFVMAMPLWIKEKLWIKSLVEEEIGFSGRMLFPEHHESHAAAAFFPSPYPEAAIITADGVGEWSTASYGVGEGNRIKILADIRFPHSLGLLYSAFTYYAGFKVNSGEYKLMGLAPYGEPKYKDLILKNLVDVKEDGSFRLNMDYFDYCAGLTMTSARFHDLFGGPPRKSESKLTQRDMDIAKSIQDVTEEIMLKTARHVHRVTGKKNLCLSGGVALNCVANGRILREGPFEKIWIQPAAGDAGSALGAALYAWYQYLGHPRKADGIKDAMKGSYLGPRYENDEIEKFLKAKGISYAKYPDEVLAGKVADLIASERVIGWLNGRMEFGPRALGARSILGDARSPKMQETMNLKIKFRESFRPFAPSVMREKVADYFEMTCESPYMLLVTGVRKAIRREMTSAECGLFGLQKLNAVRSSVPAVTHVDYSARVQTVTEEQHPVYYRVLKELNDRHGCPVLINTSFNVRGEPIVCTPEDAYRCFMRTNMDYLVLGNCLLEKKEQKPLDKDVDWLKEYELD
ncbi:MAG: carbamoyltransferase [Candidatus Omnitrophota bacterium]|jgi:carbamoyltransferase